MDERDFPTRRKAAMKLVTRVFSDVGVGPGPLDPVPIYAEMGMGTEYIKYHDIAIEPRTPPPEIPRLNVGTSPRPVAYADVGTHRTPKHIRIHEAGTSPIKISYTDVGTDVKVPERFAERLPS